MDHRFAVDVPLPEPIRLGDTRLLPAGPLRIYTCGITPYDVTHVGHAATFVWADALARIAKAVGATVESCRNTTDIDDVLTQAAERAGQPYDELAVTQEFLFERDMRALGCATPTHTPRARGHVDQVQRLAAALLDAGAAYESAGTVWFDGTGVHGRLGISDADALAGLAEFGDAAVPGERRSPFDVAVWRAVADDATDEPAFPSPWGWGRPGWHSECSAMALTYLGGSIDVLVGGVDLAYPHHAYQAAIAEAASGAHPFARAVLHVGEVRQGGAKMAKSTGNLCLVADLLKTYSGPALRLGLLNRPVREPWECAGSEFDRATDDLGRLYAAAARANDDPAAVAAVFDRLRDDLDVPGAFAIAVDAGGSSARRLIDVLQLAEA